MSSSPNSSSMDTMSLLSWSGSAKADSGEKLLLSGTPVRPDDSSPPPRARTPYCCPWRMAATVDGVVVGGGGSLGENESRCE